MLEPKIWREKGERKTRKVWSSKSNVQCSMLEPKKEEKGGLRGDQTKKCWSQKKEEKRGLRGDQTKKCWSQKNQEEKREGRSQGKHWSQNKKETGCEKSHDDISVPSFNATLLGINTQFSISELTCDLTTSSNHCIKTAQGCWVSTVSLPPFLCCFCFKIKICSNGLVF